MYESLRVVLRAEARLDFGSGRRRGIPAVPRRLPRAAMLPGGSAAGPRVRRPSGLPASPGPGHARRSVRRWQADPIAGRSNEVIGLPPTGPVVGARKATSLIQPTGCGAWFRSIVQSHSSGSQDRKFWSRRVSPRTTWDRASRPARAPGAAHRRTAWSPWRTGRDPRPLRPPIVSISVDASAFRVGLACLARS